MRTIKRVEQRYILFDLQQESAAILMGGLLVVGTLLGLLSEVLPNSLQGGLLSIILLMGLLGAWLLSQYNFTASMWMLVGSCLLTTVLAQMWYSHAILLALFALPSAMAALVLGRKASILTALITTLLLTYTYAIGQGGAGAGISAGADIVNYVISLLLVWGVMALILIALRFAQTTSQWAMISYGQMHTLLEEERNHSVELKQAQQDLITTNLQLLRLTERLEAISEIAEESRRTKEEFVANVSHELRTPLNMIIGFSDMITQTPQMYQVDLPPSLLADLAVIQRNSQHLTKLVDDVLDLSQIEAGYFSLKKDWVNVREVLDSVHEAVKPLFTAKGLYLHFDLPTLIPPLFGDGTRLRQVWLNLLSNAGRFTEEGGVTVKLWLKENCLVVSVADSGPGISPEDQTRIFEPFQQVDGSLRRRFGGNGLGLSISKRFVELHDGKIWLESTLGHGTTVFVSLPWKEQQELQPATFRSNVSRWVNPYSQFEPRTRQYKAPIVMPPPRLVVLEPGNILTRLLTRHYRGADIVALHTFEDACYELRRSPAQALIINDPSAQESGWLTQQAAALPYGTPVIGCWMPGIEQVIKQLGIRHYLMKPVMRSTLLSTVATVQTTLEHEIKTILVVDDDADTLQFFARVLGSSGRGYRVLRASDGQHALTLLRERKPDLLLLDLIMGGMDGFTVLREKSGDAEICEIPVVVASASDPFEEPMMTDFLTATRSRGITFDDLTAFIQTYCQLSGQLSSPSASLDEPPILADHGTTNGPTVDRAHSKSVPGSPASE